ncbi:MAG: Bug family tripartite tricarboxylate transporter substrate binding protein [Burkholderiales bacterium]
MQKQVIVLLMLALGVLRAEAQYPVKPVRLVVPILAGGPLDNVARIVSQALSQGLGQSVIIENRPGADGAIGAQAVLGSPADGYTLFFTNNTAVVGAPLLNKAVTYNPLTDFTPVSFVGRMTLVIYANPSLPAKSLAELVSHARANPNKLSYATSTIGDVIAGTQLLNAAGIDMVRVPYKGAAQAIPDLIEGRVHMGIAPLAAGLAHAKEGRLRMLAVILPSRSPTAPDVPTTAEAGQPGVSVTTWAAIFGPRGLPADVTARVAAEMARLGQQTEVRSQFERQGFRGEVAGPETLSKLLKEELATWSKIIKENGITQSQ